MKASEFVIISVQKNTWEAKEEYFDLDLYVGKTILVFETNSFLRSVKTEMIL